MGMKVSHGCCSVTHHVWLFVTPWTAAQQASLSITNSWRLLKLMSIESVMPSNNLILCCPLLLLPSIFPSITVFSSESALCIRWPKYWSFSFSISPSKEYSGLISFKIDWFDLLAIQGTLKSLLLEQIHGRMGGGEVRIEKVIKHRFICLIHSEAKQTKHQSLEQRKVYWRAMQWEWAAHAQETRILKCFGENCFYRQIWGEGCKMCNFFLIGWWWGNRVALQKSCAPPEVTILHPGGSLSFCKGTQWHIVKVYLLRRNQDPALSLHCSSWLFLLYFCLGRALPWLVTVWICSL